MQFTDTLITKLGQQLFNAQALAATVFRNGQPTSLAVAFTPVATGTYRYSFSLPDDWQGNDHVSVHFTYRLADFNATTSKIRLGAVASIRAANPALTLADDIAEQIVTANKAQLIRLAAEIAAQQQSRIDDRKLPAQPVGKIKRLRVTARIAKITGATAV